MKQLALLALVLVLVADSGCTRRRRAFVPIYDTCFSVHDCEPAADVCGFMSFQFGQAIFENAICTLGCFDDFDCPIGFNGEIGACYPEAFFDRIAVCSERCDFDTDCPGGFICADWTELRFLAVGDSICVPGPS